MVQKDTGQHQIFLTAAEGTPYQKAYINLIKDNPNALFNTEEQGIQVIVGKGSIMAAFHSGSLRVFELD